MRDRLTDRLLHTLYTYAMATSGRKRGSTLLSPEEECGHGQNINLHWKYLQYKSPAGKLTNQLQSIQELTTISSNWVPSSLQEVSWGNHKVQLICLTSLRDHCLVLPDVRIALFQIRGLFFNCFSQEDKSGLYQSMLSKSRSQSSTVYLFKTFLKM